MNLSKKLEKIRKDYKDYFNSSRIMVCCGTGCTSSKSEKLLEALKAEVKKRKLNGVTISKAGCFGFCAKGPIVVIDPDEIFYEMVTPDDASDIIDCYEKNITCDRLLAKENEKLIRKWHELNFYKKQDRIALQNCGKIDPENINEYIAQDGYKAIEKALTMSQDEVIKEVTSSGLRGRGGAGFLTG